MASVRPQVEEITSGVESLGEDADSENRWFFMIETGCREGMELMGVWKVLQDEEHEASAWLDKDQQETLS